MSDQKIIVEKHPRLIRWTHWVNFPLLAMMVWSGIWIYWANQAYVKIPPEWARALGLNNHLAEGMGWHFTLMWFFTANGVIYVSYLAWSGEWRHIVPRRDSFAEAWQIILHDVRLRKEPVRQSGKLNGAQRIAYTSVLAFGAGSVVTGLAIHKPVQAGGLTELLGGYEAARFEHFVFMILFILFFFVHVAQVLRAGWNNLRAMVAGYEVEDE